MRLGLWTFWHLVYWAAMDVACMLVGHKPKGGLCCKRCGRAGTVK
jgi:hypothetical protein